MSRRRVAVLLLVALISIGRSVDASAQAPPSGDVLVVGDSLEVLTSPYLRRYLPSVNLTVSVKGGYSSIQIFRLFQQSYNPSQSVIVFDAGTNDNPSYPQILAARLQAVAATVGDRCMVVPTIHGLTVHGVGDAGKNRVVQQFAASRPGTQVPDWAGLVASQPELLQSDNLHPTPLGAEVRAQLIADAVTACLQGGSLFAPLEPPSPEGPPPEPQNPERERPKPEPKPQPPPRLGDQSPVLLDQPVKWEGVGAELSGELITPGAEGRHPVVVMLHGSGPSTREDHREQAEFLAEHGIGALIFDKRGAGDSTGSPDYRLSQLADDARAAIAMLRRRPEVDPGGIGVWGFSEGGAVAPLVAGGRADVAVVVVVSPVVTTRAAQEEWAVRRELRTSDAGAGSAAVSTYYRVAADVGALASNRAADLSFAPAPAWRRVAQPVLAMWGGEDRVVPARASAAALGEALADGRNADRSFRTFPGAAHNLGVAAEAFRPGSAPGFKQLSADWLRTHLEGEPPRPTVATALPAADAVPVHALADPSPLERWPVQLAWLLVPALALAVAARRTAGAGARAWSWLGGVIALDLLALFALAYAVAGIVDATGAGVSSVAGMPSAVAVTWALTIVAFLATALLAHRARLAAVASCAWLLLVVFWLL
jgi:uncharacterized protein